jgi:TonB family protein
MRRKFRGLLIGTGALLACGTASAEWRCDCTSIVGSCSATAAARDSFIEVTSTVEQCARVDYFVDGIPFVALVTDGTARQDWIARTESPAIIIQSCQVCVDNSDSTTAPSSGSGLTSEGEAMRLISVDPVYPPAAAEAGIEGYVDVRFRLSPSGTVVAPEVVDAEPAGVFNAAALAAVSRWRYTYPATDEAPTLTERVQFSIKDAVFGLTNRRSTPTAANPVSVAPGRNSCIREEGRYDFGASVDISLINTCSEPLVVFSCATGTGSTHELWTCRNPEQAGMALVPTPAPQGSGIPVATAGGERTFAAASRLEVTRAPNSEIWWLACAVSDTGCLDDGRQWIRSIDRQTASIDPQDRTRARLARSF